MTIFLSGWNWKNTSPNGQYTEITSGASAGRAPLGRNRLEIEDDESESKNNKSLDVVWCMCSITAELIEFSMSDADNAGARTWPSVPGPHCSGPISFIRGWKTSLSGSLPAEFVMAPSLS